MGPTSTAVKRTFPFSLNLRSTNHNSKRRKFFHHPDALHSHSISQNTGPLLSQSQNSRSSRRGAALTQSKAIISLEEEDEEEEEAKETTVTWQSELELTQNSTLQRNKLSHNNNNNNNHKNYFNYSSSSSSSSSISKINHSTMKISNNEQSYSNNPRNSNENNYTYPELLEPLGDVDGIEEYGTTLPNRSDLDNFSSSKDENITAAVVDAFFTKQDTLTTQSDDLEQSRSWNRNQMENLDNSKKLTHDQNNVHMSHSNNKNIVENQNSSNSTPHLKKYHNLDQSLNDSSDQSIKEVFRTDSSSSNINQQSSNEKRDTSPSQKSRNPFTCFPTSTDDDRFNWKLLSLSPYPERSHSGHNVNNLNNCYPSNNLTTAQRKRSQFNRSNIHTMDETISSFHVNDSVVNQVSYNGSHSNSKHYHSNLMPPPLRPTPASKRYRSHHGSNSIPKDSLHLEKTNNPFISNENESISRIDLSSSRIGNKSSYHNQSYSTVKLIDLLPKYQDSLMHSSWEYQTMSQLDNLFSDYEFNIQRKNVDRFLVTSVSQEKHQCVLHCRRVAFDDASMIGYGAGNEENSQDESFERESEIDDLETMGMQFTPARDQYSQLSIDEKNNIVILVGVWRNTRVVPGQIVHVVTQDPNNFPMYVGKHDTDVVVVNPDAWLSITNITKGVSCSRKAILSDRIKSYGMHISAICGNIGHELMDAAAESKDFDLQSLEQMSEKLLHSKMKDLYQSRSTLDEAKQMVERWFPYISRWGKDQLCKEGVEVVDIEESIVSPRHGLKGFIDMTLHEESSSKTDDSFSTRKQRYPHMFHINNSSSISSSSSNNNNNNNNNNNLSNINPDVNNKFKNRRVVPMEIKTSKRTSDKLIEYRAQVQLYCLLLSERYRVPVDEGRLLWVQKQAETEAVKYDPQEMRHILNIRNEIASYLLLHGNSIHNIPSTDNNNNNNNNCNDKFSLNHNSRNNSSNNSSMKSRSSSSENSYMLSPRSNRRRNGSITLQYEGEQNDFEQSNETQLPPLSECVNTRKCRFCPQKKSCLVYSRTFESGQVAEQAQEELLSTEREEENLQFVKHLSESQIKYLRRWIQAIDAEETFMRTEYAAQWGMPGPRYEIETERCIGGLEFSERVNYSTEKEKDINQTSSSDSLYYYRFTRYKKWRVIESREFQLGDRVTVNTEDGIPEVASAIIEKMEPYSIILCFTRPFKPLKSHVNRVMLYSLRKSLYVQGPRQMRYNIINMMSDEHLRGLIADCRAPKFYEDPEQVRELQSSLSQSTRTQQDEIRYDDLNKDQRAAVDAVMAAQDYVLLQGMPGTGKTTTIAFLVQALVLAQPNCRILLTAYTHTAVDNILLKLQHYDVPFVRVSSRASTSSVHPGIRDHVFRASDYSSVAEIENALSQVRVVGAPCLSITGFDPELRFDYAIVDEASQIAQPICIAPLLHADRFVLVGDHQQLPPLVQSDEANHLGLGESLFQYLASAHSDAVYRLREQYRMNQAIQDIASRVVYQSMLYCANPNVAQAQMHLPRFADLRQAAKGYVPWLGHACSPQHPVVFLDTSPVATYNTQQQGKLNKNRGNITRGNVKEPRGYDAVELCVVEQVLRGLLHSGARCNDIGVITPFRRQERAIRALVTELIHFRKQSQEKEEKEEEKYPNSSNYKDSIEVSTIDRYQGRDKSCIILSLVRGGSRRSYEKKKTSEFLTQERLNVAFTRAKYKLIVVGNMDRAKQTETLLPFMNCMKRCVYALPPNLKGIDFDSI